MRSYGIQVLLLIVIFIMSSSICFAGTPFQIIDFNALSIDPMLAIKKPEVKWEEMYIFNDDKDIDYNRNNLYKPIGKAMVFMQNGKTEKALKEMEKIAVDKKYVNDLYGRRAAVYQLLFYKKYGTFDFKTNHYNQFNKCLCDAIDFPSTYELMYEDFIEGQRKNVSIIDLGDNAKLALLPLTGYYDNHMNDGWYSLDINKHASIYEYYIRQRIGLIQRNGLSVSFTTLLKQDYYHNQYCKFAIDAIQMIPYLYDVDSDAFNKNSFMAYANKLINNNTSDSVKEAICIYLWSAALGDSTALSKIIETAFNFYDIDSGTAGNKIANCEELLNLLLQLNEIELFNKNKSIFDNLIGLITEYKKELTKVYDAEVLHKYREEQMQNVEKAARRSQQLANYGMALLQGASETLYYMGQQSAARNNYNSYTSGVKNGGIAVPEYLRPEVFMDNYMNGRQTMPSAAQMELSGTNAIAYDAQRRALHQSQILDLQALEHTRKLQQQGMELAQKEIENFRLINGREPNSMEIQAIYDNYTKGYRDAYATYVQETIQTNNGLGLDEIQREYKPSYSARKTNTKSTASNNTISSTTTITSKTGSNVKKTSDKATASTKKTEGNASSSTTKSSNSSSSSSNTDKNDSHQQFKNGNKNVNSSDYTYKRRVSLYRQNGSKFEVSKQNVELYEKGASEYIKIGETFYVAQTPQKVTQYRKLIVYGGVGLYYN